MDPALVTLSELASEHHDVIDALRERGPVSQVPALGAWLVVGRDAAVEVMRDSERFTVDDPRFATAQVVGPSMLSLDGQEHRRHRSPFAAAFRPAATAATLGPRIDAEARRLVGAIEPDGQADLAHGLAGPLAAFASMIALGLEPIGTATLLGWYRKIVDATERSSLGLNDPAASLAADTAMSSLTAAVAEASERPDGALAQIAGLLSADELGSNAAVFLFGGIETTEGMIANLLLHLLLHPEVLARVNQDRGLIAAAIEESLRLEPAVARVDRFATTDVVLAGTSISRGDFVVVSLSGANRDPNVYRRPHEFDLDRVGEPAHLAFVQGPHACIGAHLARLVATSALSAVLDLLPAVSLDAGRDAAVEGIVFRKARSIPVTWGSAAAMG